MAVPASAKRYAQAVFQIALEESQTELWDEALKSIVDAFAEPTFALVMGSPRISLLDKTRIARQRLSSLHPTALNLAVLLITKGRHELAPSLHDEYRRLWETHRGIEHARIVTAVALTREEENTIAARLSEATGKQIQLETSIDPAIIAGIVVRLGDKIIDGSTRGQLQALKKSLARA